MDEFDIIGRYFRPLSNDQNGLGLLDDAALARPSPGHEFVITSDAIVAGIHFFATDTPQDIGMKAIGVNTSDLIAKGAAPKYYFLTLAYPPEIREGWIKAFSQTLLEQQQYYGCVLLGGDTVRTPGPLSISITMLGEVSVGKMVRRSTAQLGDYIYVSGTIGDAVMGLALHPYSKLDNPYRLDPQFVDYFWNRYYSPEPDIDLLFIVQKFASAAMDISDGLIGDLEKLCTASQVGAQIDLARVPVQDCLKGLVSRDAAFLRGLLTGGDDYEVLMTVHPDKAATLEQVAKKNNVMMTRIGIITDSTAGFSYYDGAGKPVMFDKKSYSHF